MAPFSILIETETIEPNELSSCKASMTSIVGSPIRHETAHGLKYSPKT